MEDQSPLYEIIIDSLAYGGDALGRLPDGRAVFVPLALPGELVRVRPVEEKRGYVRARLVEVLKASPERITPRCVHFGACGGCHYQHLPYEAQLAVKATIVKEQLQRLGGLPDPPVAGTVASPSPWYYRNHVQFHLSKDGRLGYEAMRSNRIIPIHECHLPEPLLNETWPQLDMESIPGLERVGLRLGAEEDILLVLESDRPAAPDFTVEETPLSAVYISPAGQLLMAGSDHLIMEVSGRPFWVSAQSFFQVNTAQAEAMLGRVVTRVKADLETRFGANSAAQASLLELYSGVGLFSAFLAPLVKRLVAVESSPSACSDFEINLDEFNNVELYEAPVEEALPHIDIQPDILLADPPRSGLGPAVQALLDKGAPLFVYISCDPATLARDAKRLAQGGYRLEQVIPFDLFPQTFHIETVSFWVKN